MEIEKIAKNLIKKEDGIFYSKQTSNISYPETGNEYCMQIEDNSFWFNHRNNIIIKAVKKFSGANRFFDIGGGNGFVCLGLKNAGIDVVLLEPGNTGAKNAVKRGIENVICSTLEDAGFEDSSMDTIGLFDVVEHIEHDVDFLKEIQKYLKRDGLVYITVPAYNLLWSNEDTEGGHFRRYTIGSLEKKLRQAGFAIHYSTYIFSILPIPIFFSRSMPSRLGLNNNSRDLQKLKNEHKASSGLLSSLLLKIWNWELNKIEESEKILFGGSCFIVGRKKSAK